MTRVPRPEGVSEFVREVVDGADLDAERTISVTLLTGDGRVIPLVCSSVEWRTIPLTDETAAEEWERQMREEDPTLARPTPRQMHVMLVNVVGVPPLEAPEGLPTCENPEHNHLTSSCEFSPRPNEEQPQLPDSVAHYEVDENGYVCEFVSPRRFVPPTAWTEDLEDLTEEQVQTLVRNYRRIFEFNMRQPLEEVSSPGYHRQSVGYHTSHEVASGSWLWSEEDDLSRDETRYDHDHPIIPERVNTSVDPHPQTQAIDEEFGWEREIEAGGDAQVVEFPPTESEKS
jgi:hypothetical protein